MVMAYEAYVIHYASSSQLATSLFLSEVAFRPYESRTWSKNMGNWALMKQGLHGNFGPNYSPVLPQLAYFNNTVLNILIDCHSCWSCILCHR